MRVKPIARVVTKVPEKNEQELFQRKNQSVNAIHCTTIPLLNACTAFAYCQLIDVTFELIIF